MELERARAGNLLTSEQATSIRRTVAAVLASDIGSLDVTAPTSEDIMRVVEPRFERVELARAWFETEALPGFSGATAQQLVESGRGQDVLDYIAAVDAGIHN